MMKDERIQFLRAIAIIAVVMIHTCPLEMGQVLFRPFINFAVPMFLFLSGYLTKEQSGGWLSFYKRRISRVLIPYILWTVIYTLPSSQPLTYCYNLLTTKACYTLYYIFVYIQFVLLTPLVFKLAKSSFNWIGWLISPIAIFIFKYPDFIWDIDYNKSILRLWSVSCLGWFTFYYMGIALRDKGASICAKTKVILILLLVSIFIQWGEGYLLLKQGLVNCGTTVKLSALLTSSLCILLSMSYIKSVKIKITNQTLILIGNYSFGVYLLHPLILEFANRLDFYRDIPFVLNSLIILCISLLLCCSVSKIAGRKLNQWLGLK